MKCQEDLLITNFKCRFRLIVISVILIYLWKNVCLLELTGSMTQFMQTKLDKTRYVRFTSVFYLYSILRSIRLFSSILPTFWCCKVHKITRQFQLLDNSALEHELFAHRNVLLTKSFTIIISFGWTNSFNDL